MDEERLAVRAPLDPGGMVELDVGPDGLVLLGSEVFGEPDQDAAIVGAGGQHFAVLAQAHVQDSAAVALQAGQEPGVLEGRLLGFAIGLGGLLASDT